MASHTKVLADWSCASTEAVVSKDEAQVEVAKADWRKLAETFWQTTEEQAPKKPKGKIHRKPSHARLLSADRQMMVTLGVGYRHFCLPPPEVRPPPMEWPLSMIACDEGSDGICATNYLIYKMGCGLVRFRDVSHRTWNNCCDAMRDAGVWNFFLLAGAAMSVDGGPWSDQSSSPAGKRLRNT